MGSCLGSCPACSSYQYTSWDSGCSAWTIKACPPNPSPSIASASLLSRHLVGLIHPGQAPHRLRRGPQLASFCSLCCAHSNASLSPACFDSTPSLPPACFDSCPSSYYSSCSPELHVMRAASAAQPHLRPCRCGLQRRHHQGFLPLHVRMHSKGDAPEQAADSLIATIMV